ncbi:chromosome partitioning protein, ParB family [Geosporobacter subterraneus DSM 17957]|uniref:Chromosome partitioning protein, ParB family n=1 Tax=Geosporobacter subterraneus DSM 17957 TaxID=1121919 RepID=A0A1M6HGG1_9FIRM|nr:MULTISPECIES: ParB/RepB/Spo0J family partition protein [Clostridia]SHJ21263.1 chromosome partitioning protein, ParB family [Geosporobacter subterraneus DSM 17957]
MAKTKGALALASYDDIFRISDTVTEVNAEKVIEMPLDKLCPPEFHPFQVRNDEAMKKTAESVKKYGVLVPGLVRPRTDGNYELVAGNRRKLASELAGRTTMPVIVREMDDDEAVIIMVDTNLEQRESLLPSEKAWAYRMKLEALKHRGIVVDGIDIGTLSVTVVSKQAGESKSQIYRMIRLTELVPGLIDLVDAKKIAFNPAVELSYLSRKEQSSLMDAMAKYEATPSLPQAQRLKKHSQSGELTPEMIDSILAEEKKEPVKLTLAGSRLKQYFPQDYTPKQMEKVIMGLLENWHKKQAVS